MPNFFHEEVFLTSDNDNNLQQIIVGIDEAGRGAWAGPIVAAAVHFPIQDPEMYRIIPMLDDSKKIPAYRRAQIFTLLTTHPKIHHGIGIVSAEEIDQINIHQANLKAMEIAFKELNLSKPANILIDGQHAPASLRAYSKTIVNGDAQSNLIAAASIVAKVYRDNVMEELDKIHPEYKWARNKGYGTLDHQRALKDFGATPYHRQSYAPIKELKKSNV